MIKYVWIIVHLTRQNLILLVLLYYWLDLPHQPIEFFAGGRPTPTEEHPPNVHDIDILIWTHGVAGFAISFPPPLTLLFSPGVFTIAPVGSIAWNRINRRNSHTSYWREISTEVVVVAMSLCFSVCVFVRYNWLIVDHAQTVKGQKLQQFLWLKCAFYTPNLFLVFLFQYTKQKSKFKSIKYNNYP